MKHRAHFVLAILAAIFAASSGRAQSNVAEQYLIAAANQERAAQNLPPLVPDPALHAAALNHAREMVTHQDISHQFPGEPGLFPRVQAYTQNFDAVAENVAYAPTVDRIHTGWMNSQGHRANMLDPRYNAIGVAVLVNGREIYAVQDFGQSGTMHTPQISNRQQAYAPPNTPETPSHPGRTPGYQATAATTDDPEARILFASANYERAQRSLPQLRWDDALTQAAAFHAAQMASRGTISHQFSGEPELSQRGAAAGAHFSLIAENVAEAPSAAIVHDAWMKSPGHRENLLDPKVDSVGIAVVVRNGQRYAVQDFARITQNLSLEQQEATVAVILEDKGLGLLPDDNDARATCATETGFRGTRQPGFILRYTAASLDVLPDQISPRLASGRYHAASVGACTAASGSFSSYRIAILLYP